MKLSVPFFGTQREFKAHRPALLRRVEAVLRSGQVLQGGEVRELEKRLTAVAGRRHAVAVNSCTDALYFALTAAGVRPGDEVLVTDFSFVASASCILRAGAVPVFVDIGPDYLMDFDKARARLSRKTKALILVHLYGAMVDPALADAFCRENELILIEDAAQAIGARRGGRAAGSLGEASCFSFDPTKPIGAPGSGGALLTDRDDVAEKVRRLRYHGKSPDKAVFLDLGFNCQMPTLTASALVHKLKQAAAWQRRRRAIARTYTRGLTGLPITTPDEPADSTHIYHKYVIRTDRRNDLRDHLTRQGIETLVHYASPLHRQPCFASAGQDDALFPTAKRFSETVLSLPIHPFLTDGEARAVVGAIRRFFGAS